jgi:hypothetical protein
MNAADVAFGSFKNAAIISEELLGDGFNVKGVVVQLLNGER